jgi:O-antigen/teichoic acid export membrane protein
MDLKVITDLLFPAGFLGWLWWSRDSLSLMSIFAAYLVARLFSLVVGFLLASTLVRVRIRKMELNKVIGLWKMTWPMGIFLMLFATYDRAIDTILIQGYLGATNVAWYGLAYKIYGVLLQPAYYYVNSIFPFLSAKGSEKRRLFGWSAAIMVGASILLVGGTYVMAPVMIYTLGGVDFEPAILILRILILASVFSYAGHLLGFTLISLGGQKEMLKIGVVAIVLNLLMNMVFIPTYGVLAAAWVTVLTEAVDCGMMGYFLYKKSR